MSPQLVVQLNLVAKSRLQRARHSGHRPVRCSTADGIVSPSHSNQAAAGLGYQAENPNGAAQFLHMPDKQYKCNIASMYMGQCHTIVRCLMQAGCTTAKLARVLECTLHLRRNSMVNLIYHQLHLSHCWRNLAVLLASAHAAELAFEAALQGSCYGSIAREMMNKCLNTLVTLVHVSPQPCIR